MMTSHAACKLGFASCYSVAVCHPDRQAAFVAEVHRWLLRTRGTVPRFNLVSPKEITIVHEIKMKRLTYEPDQEIVSAELTGTMGGRNVELQLRFPLRVHGERPGVDLSKVALLEMQQILRSASNIALPEITDPAAGAVVAPAPATPQSGTAGWENEGGAVRIPRREIVWFGI